MPDAPASDFQEAFAGMPLLTIKPSGEAPPSRVKDAAALRSGFVLARQEDELRALHRAQEQDLLDGGTPYTEDELADQPDAANLNFGGAEQTLEKAMAPYHDLVNSDESLVAVSTLYGSEDERDDLNTILSEEITNTIRGNEMFPYETTRLAHLHVGFFMGVGYWPDDIDWRYKADGLGQFYFPRLSVACESKLPLVYSVEEYSQTELYDIVREFMDTKASYDAEENTDPSEEPDEADFRGWNIPALKLAITNANTAEPPYYDWERLGQIVKNNDIIMASSLPVIRVVNGWVKEYNGHVSLYKITETAVESEGFLYVGRSIYRNMRDALVLFPYGLGTNTKIHGGRGLIHKIYAFEQQRNRSLCRLIDQGGLASSLMVQPGDESDLTSVGLQYYGNLAVLEPGAKVVPYAAPDLQRTVMPVLQEMERLRNERIVGYTAESAFDGDQRKTKFEVGANLQQNSQLSGTQQDFWNAPYERLMQGTLRRMIRRDYVPMDPGGEDIADLQLRLTRRGVPLEALWLIDVKATRFVRAIGAGSASARSLALQKTSELRPRMDPVGQANLDRDLAADAVGSAKANRYFPANKVKRNTLDTNMAVVESILLVAGNDIKVQPSDAHLAHAREHIKPLVADFQAQQQGQVPIDQMAMKDRLLYQHTADHVDQISGDPSSVEEAAQMRKIMQQVGEVISNGLRKAQAAAAKQQEAQAQGQPPADGSQPQSGPSDQDIRDMDLHRKEMEFMQQKHDTALQQMIQTAETKRNIATADARTRRSTADADTAAKIARETAVAKARLNTKSPQK